MAAGQFLSLPSVSAGAAPISSSSAWAFGSAVTLSASLPVGIKVIGFQFQNTDTPALDVNQDILFEVTVGGTTKLQIPFNMKADTLVGYHMTSSASTQSFYFPEPYLIPGGSAVGVKATDSIDAALTYDGVKLIYEETTPPTVALNTPADAATVADTTPALVFTGTDIEADAIEYNVQIVAGGTYTGTMVSQPTVQFADPIYGGTAGSGEGSQARGQSFIADGQYISRLTIFTWTAGVPTGDWIVSIRDGLDGNILTSVTKAMSAVANGGWNNFDLTVPFPTVNGTKYYIHIIKSPDIRDISNFGYVSIKDSNVYVDGGYLSKTDNVWSEDVSAYDMVFTVYSPTTLGKFSAIDLGFSNITNGANSHPFTSGDQIGYTVQAGDALAAGTYYWRVAGIDPLGNNSYGAWSAIWSFTITTGGSTGIKVWNGSAWGYKPVKVWNGSAWVVKPVKVWNGSAWVVKG